ncbi:MAG: hypothetical protein FIB03_03170 [Anaerolineae bacterium]|nr:hypothetical protein [Anaerolineae bacterium]
MTEKNRRPRVSPPDDEIDLRTLIATLWQGRVLIGGAILLLALTAFALSRWVLTPGYESEAYLTVRTVIIEPGSANGDWRSNAVKPDVRAVLAMATSDGLLQQVLNDETVRSLFAGEEEPLTLEGLKSIASASLDGVDLIRLHIKDSDPERASTLANRWAEIMRDNTNRVYGVAQAGTVLNAALDEAEGGYRQAQQALELALADNRSIQLETQLTAVQEDLACVLSRRTKLEQTANDLRELEANWADLPAKAIVPVSDALSLMELKQRAFLDPCQLPAGGTQLQVGSDALADLTVADALQEAGRMQGLITALIGQLQPLEESLNQRLLSLSQAHEKAQAQLDLLQKRRDDARELYGNLQDRLALYEAVFREGSQVALISVPATAPEEPSSPSTLLNTLVAALLGGVLGAFVVLWRAWGENPAR